MIPPMGVSQWMEHGKKYGYWDFFLKEKNIMTRPEIESIDKIRERLQLFIDTHKWDMEHIVDWKERSELWYIIGMLEGIVLLEKDRMKRQGELL
jgi:hypothetical protein